jgi:hypothetical protein
MPDLADNNVITADGAFTKEVLATGKHQISIGNATGDAFESTTITGKVGATFAMDGVATLAVPHMLNIDLVKGEVLTFTAASTATTPQITVQVTKLPD